MIASIAILLALGATPAPAQANASTPAATMVAVAAPMQQGEVAAHGNVARETIAESKRDGVDFMEHILDSHELEIPFTRRHVDLRETLGEWKVAGIDFTPTRHVVFMLIAALLVIVVVVGGASLAGRAQGGRTAGKRHNALEALVLFLRDEVVMRNIDHGARFAPFIITLFFFILFCNLLGLLPWGATATANVSVTAALAVLTFLVTEVSGMMAQGPAYLGTVFYWNKSLHPVMRVLMFFIMTPVEMVGKITKPFALAVRLMANMTAGHIVLLAIISLIFVFKSYVIGIAPVAMAVAISFLELFVSFLQAYIFALLSAVFIGMMQHAHH